MEVAPNTILVKEGDMVRVLHTYIYTYIHTYIHPYIHTYVLGLCDNGKTYISIMPIMHYKIISITIVITIKL